MSQQEYSSAVAGMLQRRDPNAVTASTTQRSTITRRYARTTGSSAAPREMICQRSGSAIRQRAKRSERSEGARIVTRAVVDTREAMSDRV